MSCLVFLKVSLGAETAKGGLSQRVTFMQLILGWQATGAQRLTTSCVSSCHKMSLLVLSVAEQGEKQAGVHKL